VIFVNLTAGQSVVQQNGPTAAFEARYTQPDALWRGSSVTATLGGDLGIEYAFQYVGPRLQLQLAQAMWRDRVFLAASYNFQFLGFFAPTFRQSDLNDPTRAGLLFGYQNPYRLGWWQTDLSLDLRDRPLDAHRGAYFAVHGELGGEYAGGAFAYEKIAPEARAYLPLARWLTLAGHVAWGRLFSTGDLGSPITRRFYLGGSDSHRGFVYQRLAPQVPSGAAGISPIPIGGDEMLLLQAELRAAFGDGPLGLGLAAFLDAGDVAAPSCASCGAGALGYAGIDVHKLHVAAGGGLRLRTPVGSLRLDVGVRLNRFSPTEADGTPNPDPASQWWQRVAVHLSIGEAF
jgi:outer membrane protein assembly factor BamA